MAGLMFWKRKRKDEAQPNPVVEIETPIEVTIEAASESPAELEPDSTVSPAIELTIEPAVSPVVEQAVEPSNTSALENPEIVEPDVLADDLQPTELPKRSAKKGIRSLFSRVRFDPENLDELEDILIQADFGVDAAAQIVAEVKQRAKAAKAETEAELKQILAQIIAEELAHPNSSLNLSDGKLPYVFLVVGVNGVGKTTTIGKLANWLVEGDWTVIIGAADTFRAAAVDQIATWAQRAGAEIVRPNQEGQDPASVAYEAVERAIAQDADILLIDTAGRLQNKADLMAELEKIRRVVEKRAQINEVLLVLDATTGQNGLAQAKAFAEIAQVTGVVLTKLDGTAKGGIVFSIQRELGIPVKLVGVGEGINDFAFFDPQEFANGLVS